MNNSRKWFYKNRTQSKVIEDVPQWYKDIENDYLKALEQKCLLEEKIRDLRDQLLYSMKDDDIHRINTAKTNVCIIHEYKGRRVDVGKLRKEMPDIFFKYSNPYIMHEHLQVTIKKS